MGETRDPHKPGWVVFEGETPAGASHERDVHKDLTGVPVTFRAFRIDPTSRVMYGVDVEVKDTGTEFVVEVSHDKAELGSL